ncbi:exported hypothetical protein [uncultured Mycobacterium sp.]|uniref:Uncharacterized protein n=1 Tax=uncultured Mycobacterium sp. TaxID=171292 RepID=A0A1Y5PIP6_9MYCO|nr:exported hypothetical protein [uncultured Mycobacterium sp.]
MKYSVVAQMIGVVGAIAAGALATVGLASVPPEVRPKGPRCSGGNGVGCYL